MSAPATPRTGVVACSNCGRCNRVPAAASSVPNCGTVPALRSWLDQALRLKEDDRS